MTTANTFRAALTLALVGSAITIGDIAQARGVVHGGRNGNGGTAVAGPRGAAASGHTTTKNADGSTTVNSTGGFAGTNGSRGYRQSSTTVGTDGSVSRTGSANASGVNGSAQTSGGFSRAADGTWSGSRSTSATNANTGNSYSGSTSIDPATGKPVHTGTCTNASGVSAPCR
ncbi:MAG: hypothetical protein WC803_04090 [Sphingomonas sp.]|jgi:hypothetical protein